MRYYKLDENGNQLGSYKWPNSDAIKLPDAPGDDYLWNGEKWVLKPQSVLDSEQATKDIAEINISERGLEDLIVTLISKGTIKLEDLPQELQDNFNLKAELRLKIDN